MAGLGRRPPTDDKHLLKYPYRLAAEQVVERVESHLALPYTYRPKYDQGDTSQCVGFSCSWATSILNRHYYDAPWLYRQAQLIDEWPGESYDGTSVRAGLDVLHDQGHVQVMRGKDRPLDYAAGIAEFRWATTVDQIRTAIATGHPVILGIDWFNAFFDPIQKGREWWLPNDVTGRIAGGHAICCYGASDRRQAVKLVNSWGTSYPLVWVSYRTLEYLLGGYTSPGEAAVLIDR